MRVFEQRLKQAWFQRSPKHFQPVEGDPTCISEIEDIQSAEEYIAKLKGEGYSMDRVGNLIIHDQHQRPVYDLDGEGNYLMIWEMAA